MKGRRIQSAHSTSTLTQLPHMDNYNYPPYTVTHTVTITVLMRNQLPHSDNTHLTKSDYGLLNSISRFSPSAVSRSGARLLLGRLD